MVYRGKSEPVLLAVLAVDAIATLGIATWLTWSAATGRMPVYFLAVGPGLVMSCAVAAWIILRTSYEVDNGELIVRQGPNKKRIPVSSIDEVFPTKDARLSPAWAGDRLQVMFTPGTKAGTLFLAPEDRTGFLEALAEADPGLRYDGEKVSRGTPR